MVLQAQGRVRFCSRECEDAVFVSAESRRCLNGPYPSRHRLYAYIEHSRALPLSCGHCGVNMESILIFYTSHRSLHIRSGCMITVAEICGFVQLLAVITFFIRFKNMVTNLRIAHESLFLYCCCSYETNSHALKLLCTFIILYLELCTLRPH